MNPTDLMSLFGNGMFPVVVAGYLLLRVERKLDQLTIVLTQIATKQGVGVTPVQSPLEGGAPRGSP